ncbi:hypothetical protein LOY39_00705 [Pseudomonas rhodesiae]|jgi:DNA-binding transcriptional ArsR family regulator|uniref:hypothetical protein n=1 Tax=Pseudomonas TaxID=286 RepID=UPI00054C21E0|nr:MULTISPECIES: hypothetical protein [Pseudomonas]KAF6687042.1 hypothetical protein HFD98_25170 [Pseudomonas sp. EKM23D]MBB4815636.1 DNA-binding transcriptional ArsR family regulator [Pseudomonas rhodesiae]PHN37511.1 hypothetical protein AO259_25130 [Pseudomonas sp. ICMP 564]QKJ71316.1 hypothetical protein HRH33_01600 [Pseudomonas rhodesiae]UVL09253.1 hypothetical protein LOY39_00705 [Pseudomonas rhodesiae]
MKSQDIVILFKLISLELQAVKERATGKEAETLVFLAGSEWKGWEDSDGDTLPTNSDSYSVRALSASLALSKSEVSNSLNRCREIGLIHTNRLSGQPLVRREALLDFVKYGIRYVFPAKPGAVVRGIPTAFGAPILTGKVMSGGDLIPVWPDAYGKSKGQEIAPLYKTVPGAVKKDELLYHFLALVDAIRIGGPRETKVADALLRELIL